MKRIFFGLTLVLLWQSAEANSQSVAEAARKERERRAAIGQATQREQQKAPESSTVITSNSSGMSEFSNNDLGIRLTVPNSWQSRVNVPTSSVLFICSEWEYGCRLTVGSEVAPKNLTSITDAQRKAWAFQFMDNRVQVTARDFSVASLPAFESRGVDPDGSETRYIHVLARDFGRIYIFTFQARGKQHDEYARGFDQVLQTFSPVQTSGYAGKSEEPLRFVEEEQEAYKTMFGIFLASMICGSESMKLCSVEEMIQSPVLRMDATGIQSLTGNPDYAFRISGTFDIYEIAAIPKRAGVGGFLRDEHGVHYNPRGPASESDPLARGEDLPRLGLIPR